MAKPQSKPEKKIDTCPPTPLKYEHLTSFASLRRLRVDFAAFTRQLYVVCPSLTELHLSENTYIVVPQGIAPRKRMNNEKSTAYLASTYSVAVNHRVQPAKLGVVCRSQKSGPWGQPIGWDIRGNRCYRLFTSMALCFLRIGLPCKIPLAAWTQKMKQELQHQTSLPTGSPLGAEM